MFEICMVPSRKETSRKLNEPKGGEKGEIKMGQGMQMLFQTLRIICKTNPTNFRARKGMIKGENLQDASTLRLDTDVKGECPEPKKLPGKVPKKRKRRDQTGPGQGPQLGGGSGGQGGKKHEASQFQRFKTGPCRTGGDVKRN